MAKQLTNKLNPWLIVGGVLLALIIMLALWLASAYNGLVSLDVQVDEKWANIQADYQRRADLIPNLVATVKKYTDYEGSVLVEVTQARSAWAGAKTPSEQQAAAGAMDSALGRLIAVAESYPNLKANENYLSLQDELAGTENRVKFSRTEFNAAVKAFNARVRSFPTNLIAGMFGFAPRESFAATPGSETAPDVGNLFGDTTK